MGSYGVRNLTDGPVYKQLLQLAMPIMATNFIQMAYTLTDMAWVGRLGSHEVAVVGGVGILIWLSTSFSLLTKIAAEISIARCIGKNELGEARIYASQSVTISFLLGCLIAVGLITAAGPVVSFFRLEEGVSELGVSYLRIVTLALPMSYLTYTFAGIYNGTGRTTIPFYLIASGLVANMVLDPLFIFGIGRFGGWGTNGAALATVLSQSLVIALFIWQMKQKNGILNRFPYWVKLKAPYVRTIFKLGTPIALMYGLFAAINFFIARIASIYGGHLGVMSQATGSQIEGITWNASSGFATALGTFTAQNHAAGKRDRIRRAYRYTLITLLTLGTVVTISFISFGEEIFAVFVPEEAARIAGGEYLFIMAFCQIFMMIENTTLGLWNGYGRTIPPAVISITLNIARVPLALLLAPTYGVNGVWIAIVISAVLKGIVSPLWWRFKKR